MKLETGLRLSTYSTVAIASGCLAYAEEPYLPGIAFFALPLAALLVLAYWVDGRWSLSAQGANGLGLLISVGWVAWLIFFSDEFEDPLGRPPWPAVFLPYLGPLLMVLLLVKLFRPKGIKDYWYIHAIGLIEVAVGCVLVVEPYFGTMLLGYILCAFWSLTLFYSYRESVKATENSVSPGGAATTVPQIVVAEAGKEIPWRYLGFWSTARKALAVVAVSLVLFFLTPQHGTTEAMSFFLNRAAHAQTGFANAPVDLKTSGQLDVDESVAFEVYAENPDGTPKMLSPTICWRGMSLHHYSKKDGSWLHPSRGNYPTAFQRQSSKDLPDLGNEQYYLTFQGNTGHSHGLFLAEPIIITSIPNKNPSRQPETRLPYVSRNFESPGLFGYDKRADRVSSIVPLSPMDFNYQQVIRPGRGDGLSDVIPCFVAGVREVDSAEPGSRQTPQVRTDDSFEDELQLTRNLLDQPVKGIRNWTQERLDQLIQQGKLEKKDVSKETSWPKDRRVPLARTNRAKVARALSDYLAFSGEYVYSLHLQPLDSTKDPTEDFLLNVKQGHCERFATGLALMLRSAGIPCRLVAGFRGADSKNPLEPDNGWYVVRQSHAHTWVEALVGHRNEQGKTELRWLTLDPSPLQEEDTAQNLSFAQWWERSLQFLRTFWRAYIVEYNTEQQGNALQALWSRLAPADKLEAFGAWVQREPYWLVGFAFMLVGLVWLRRPKSARRLGTGSAAEIAFYHRLVSLMDRRCRLTPGVGDTPREFSAKAQELLAARKIGTALLDLPNRIVELFYQVRYGGMKIPPDQVQEIDRQLYLLNAALKNGPRPLVQS